MERYRLPPPYLPSRPGPSSSTCSPSAGAYLVEGPSQRGKGINTLTAQRCLPRPGTAPRRTAHGARWHNARTLDRLHRHSSPSLRVFRPWRPRPSHDGSASHGTAEESRPQTVRRVVRRVRRPQAQALAQAQAQAQAQAPSRLQRVAQRRREKGGGHRDGNRSTSVSLPRRLLAPRRILPRAPAWASDGRRGSAEWCPSTDARCVADLLPPSPTRDLALR
jgi:hypothetical protein